MSSLFSSIVENMMSVYDVKLSSCKADKSAKLQVYVLVNFKEDTPRVVGVYSNREAVHIAASRLGLQITEYGVIKKSVKGSRILLHNHEQSLTLVRK